MERGDELFSGKAKSVYRTSDSELIIIHFRDDTSAFDGEKVEQLLDKGKVNNIFNAYIMDLLGSEGVPTHFVRRLSDTDSLVKKLEMFPIECVVRNYAAGSLCKRYGLEEGISIDPPTFEFFLKNDELHDPMINDSHIITFGWANLEHINEMKELTFKVNSILKRVFLASDMLLVDYKLEFGLSNGELTLGDEFSPDGCRIWDKITRNKMDKDRFRQSLGNVIETYKEVAHRLGIDLN